MSARVERAPSPTNGTTRAAGSGSPIGGGTGNRFPEPMGTAGTDGDPFAPLARFYEEAATLPDPAWLIPDLIPDSGAGLIVSAPNAASDGSANHDLGRILAT